jgi:hypothetical protein
MRPDFKHLRFYALVFVLFFIFVLCGVTLSAQEQIKKRPVEIDDLFKLKRVGDPEISPDGKWVAYTVTRTDLKKDKSETRVWMVPALGGEPLPMTGEG